ncbi:TonB-dependent receptor domain-containing protein [Massilia sp. TS11]|uniref:TonB-dependent receptor domain-containing protein n=1 Tax=Massilia sp. TS11 TaxID=2908003 RepID=UPI001EDA2E72|nr:TonB-dependent receptor [Massilia sp. TS11]MCG2585904.1 TonB-dependent receptor [Massilia sp. TS11]
MMVETVLSRSVRMICASGLALGASAAFAQEAQQPMQKVEVTGSRIPTQNLEGTSPVTVIGAKDIKTDGVRDVESLLNNMPSVFAAQTGNVVNGASGTATVDLRGLGANRTLVLVNGHRLPMGSANSVAADLNQIPAALIKRVEILTGGAGAVYGADAVAGVVNFIMNDRFEGVQVELNGSGYQHKQHGTAGVASIVAGRAASNPGQFHVPGDVNSLDGKSKEFALTMGGNFDNNKGNATLFFNFKRTDALLQSERDWSACSLSSSAAGFACGGSGTNATGRITNLTTGKVYTTDATGTPRAYSTATDAYNFGPINHLQRPDDRYGLAASLHYDIDDKTRVYADIAAHDDHTDAQIAPGGLFGDVYTVKYDNPFLTPAWRTALGLNKAGDSTDVVIQRRNVEGGGRVADFTNTSIRSIIGVKGEIGKWTYDVFAQAAKVRSTGASQNYFSSERAKRAFDVVNQNGTAVCASVVNQTDPACVPYNVWKVGAVTPAMLNYLQIPGTQSGFTEQQIQGANMAADLGEYGLQLPGAKSGVGVSFGVERRTEKLELNPDAASQAGDLSGSGGPATPQKGSYTVKDVFGEVRLPILEGKEFAENLATNMSFRHTNISTGTSANTFGIGLDWQPMSSFKLRASHQKAVRAPNVIELFSPAGLGLYDNDADPCAGDKPSASAAACARTGVTAAQYGKIQDSPAGQYNANFGGNTKLSPETAKSNTVGLVLTPMRNLSFTIDYFDIKVKDTISNVSPTTTLQKCLDTGNPLFCSKIHRDALGTLWLLPQGYIEATNVNIGSLRTTGIDVSANYAFKVADYGSFGIAMNGTYLDKFEVEELPGEGSYDCAGLYNGSGKCGQPRPVWRHKLRVNWNSPWNVDFAATWRHFDSVKLEKDSNQALLKGSFNAVDNNMSARDYLDLAATWNITKKIALLGGINNLFDKDPPITSLYGTGSGNGNTFPSLYDAQGRKFFLNLTAKF